MKAEVVVVSFVLALELRHWGGALTKGFWPAKVAVPNPFDSAPPPPREI